MTISADRILGSFFCLFVLAMYFFGIHVYVERPECGSLSSHTLPNTISLYIACIACCL